MNKPKKRLSTLDKILLFCGISVLVFTLIMIVIFCIYQSVPDTLIVSFFGVFTGEGVSVGVFGQKRRRLT